MHLGPFDRRTRRSRCAPCAASHSKCSGSNPCTQCQKRCIECVFPAASAPSNGAAIRLAKGKFFTAKSFTKPITQRPVPPPSDNTATYLFYFDVFIRKNSFTGRGPSFLSDVQQLVKTSGQTMRAPFNHLLDAMLALGAMQANMLGALNCENSLRFALEHYLRSITSLRRAVMDHALTRKDSILWSTFFLGLFELLQDTSGQRWLQHMVFGTSQALIASGPSACTSGPTRNFFIQARTFEVCRSIIFNQSSFLAAPEWMELTGNLSEEANTERRVSLDDLLNLIVLCSRLRARTGQFIRTYTSLSGVEVLSIDALELATEGFYLRDALERWRNDASFPSVQHDEMLLATSYYSATSIYLSGNYDYDIRHWQAMTVAVPVLRRDEISKHVEDILQTTREAFRSSTLSPLLHLFPLRVAGARSRENSQRQAVTECLLEVKKQFAVADAMLVELDELWSLTPIELVDLPLIDN
ncbi:hypothetical protein BDP55DRAFT_214581 [Colletotrichum godetiae]|uniref:Zn(2)-C6 fungal-type domain-containing protein n=1 Tax=Colletotrichum godetiae TaxID=1209918 RepID=A0AAJ0AXG4_9PEZI|nr:uncharacterized protein BDP55DRAFT_214581 [Colletotrichum godetiae]KAK1700038.1 hypothetical protein BDP55DRAFT_214581 [Colletotrichum godetiae]